MSRRAGILAGVVAAWALLAVPAAAKPPSPGDSPTLAPPPPGGALAQLADPFGCHRAAPLPAGSPCSAAKGLGIESSSRDIAISPDGRNLYAIARRKGLPPAVAAFSRDPATGALTQPIGACISDQFWTDVAEDPDCAPTSEPALGYASNGALAISPDGDHVYVAAPARGVVSVFYRYSSQNLLGVLQRLPGKNGCISQGGKLVGKTDGCRWAKGLAEGSVRDLAISSDGKNVYLTVSGGKKGDQDTLLTLQRSTSGNTRGVLTFVDCLSSEGEEGCKKITGLSRPFAVAVSPDGKNVYVGNRFSDALVALSRDAATGKLTQLAGSEGCISDDAGDGPTTPGCKSGKALDEPMHVTVSPDGKNVYASGWRPGSGTGATAIFYRNPSTGALGQLACLNATGSGSCAKAAGYNPWGGLAISPDGQNAYAGSSKTGGLLVFSRRTTGLLTGLLDQLSGAQGCVRDPDDGGLQGCGSAHDLSNARWVEVSPDGRNVYVGGVGGGALTSFARNPVPECKDKTVDNTGGSGADIQLECTDPLGKPLTYSIVSQPDKGNVTIDQATAVAYYVPQASFIGPDPFTYKASNGTQESNVATITVNNVAG